MLLNIFTPEKDSESKKKNGKHPPNRWSIVYYIIITVVLLVVQFSILSTKSSVSIPYSTFKQFVKDGKIESLQISPTLIYGKVKQSVSLDEFESKTLGVKNFSFQKEPSHEFHTFLIKDENLLSLLEQNQIKYEGISDSTWFGNLMEWLLPFGILIAIYFFVFRRINISSPTLNIGKSKASLYESPDMNTKVTFKDVAGLNEAKEEVMEIVDFLKDPKRFTKLGGKLPKGVLLVGPPGTGKTLMAKAVAGEAGVPFFSLSGSDFVEMFVGVGAARVRDLFKNAKEKAPCIIFIDEIDAVGRSRGRGIMMGNNDERESTLNQLLVEMDGFATDKGVILIGATNRPDVLDSALLRPGRFDRQIVIDRPDMEGRIEIFKVHTKSMSVNESVNLRMLASQTPGFAGAEIANVCNEAALLASRRNKELIELIDFQDAIERVIAGLEKKNKVINVKERKIVAFHESGHAIVSWLMPPNDPVQKVSIVPRGVGALGYTINVPLEDRYLMTKNELIARMCGLLGGRVAEDIIFGEISTGAQNDLERITELAYNMVTVYGMSPEIGYLSFPPSNQNHYIYGSTGQRTFSEETSKLIDSEAKKLIADATQTTKSLLEHNKDKLNLMANELLQREVLNYNDLETILGKRQGDEPFRQADLNETNNNSATIVDTKNFNPDNSNIEHEERIELETAVEKIKSSRNKATP